MNKKGYTLIELMIVIAIMGVIMTSLSLSDQNIKRTLRFKDEKFQQNKELLNFYSQLKKFTRGCNKVIIANERMVEFNDGNVMKSLHNGRKIMLNSKVFTFGKTVKIWGFEKYSENSFLMDFRIKNDRFNIVWRVNQ